MNRNESERRQTKKRNTLSLSEINNKYTSFFSVLIFIFIYLFKFFGHVQLVQQAYFYEFHFGHVLYNQMCNYVHLHSDVMDRIDRHNGNQSLKRKRQNKTFRISFLKTLYRSIQVFYYMMAMYIYYVFSYQHLMQSMETLN